VCRFLLFSLFRRSRWRLLVGSSGFYVLDFVLKPVADVELSKEVFTSKTRWMPLTVEWNDSANTFYLLKNILLLIHVIFKLKRNDLSFNEIMMLNALYVCLHAFSLRRELPNSDPRRRTPHFWVGCVTWRKAQIDCTAYTSTSYGPAGPELFVLNVPLNSALTKAI
jgi:hypothetical protein